MKAKVEPSARPSWSLVNRKNKQVIVKQSANQRGKWKACVLANRLGTSMGTEYRKTNTRIGKEKEQRLKNHAR
jgi:hypothetical protein